MKKILILILSLTLFLCIFTGCSNESQDKTQNGIQEKEESKIKEYSIPIYENKDIKVTLISISEFDDDFDQICFDVYNKMDQLIKFALDTIEIDGRTETGTFSSEIISKTTGESCELIPSGKNLNQLTAYFYYYDKDGDTIDKFNVKNIMIKKD